MDNMKLLLILFINIFFQVIFKMNFEQLRIKIEDDQIYESGKVSRFFDILPNDIDLNEEFLYTHQPITDNVIYIYSTSSEPIGKLDNNEENRTSFNVLQSPVIVVARKGYAGRLYVVEDRNIIIHEDAYAVKPKPEYINHINLHWFVGHYSYEFQQHRTSPWGIGDFPRTLFNNMNVIIPAIEVQNQVVTLYQKRAKLLNKISNIQGSINLQINDIISESLSF